MGAAEANDNNPDGNQVIEKNDDVVAVAATADINADVDAKDELVQDLVDQAVAATSYNNTTGDDDDLVVIEERLVNPVGGDADMTNATKVKAEVEDLTFVVVKEEAETLYVQLGDQTLQGNLFIEKTDDMLAAPVTANINVNIDAKEPLVLEKTGQVAATADNNNNINNNNADNDDDDLVVIEERLVNPVPGDADRTKATKVKTEVEDLTLVVVKEEAETLYVQHGDQTLQGNLFIEKTDDMLAAPATANINGNMDAKEPHVQENTDQVAAAADDHNNINTNNADDELDVVFIEERLIKPVPGAADMTNATKVKREVEVLPSDVARGKAEALYVQHGDQTLQGNLVIEKTEEIMRTAAATDISADVDDIEEIVQEKIDQVATADDSNNNSDDDDIVFIEERLVKPDLGAANLTNAVKVETEVENSRLISVKEEAAALYLQLSNPTLVCEEANRFQARSGRKRKGAAETGSPGKRKRPSVRVLKVRLNRDEVSRWRNCKDCDVYFETDELLLQHEFVCYKLW